MRMRKSKNIKKLIWLFLFLCPFFYTKEVEAKPKTNMHIEVPKINEVCRDSMVISGWLMSESDSPGIYIYIDNQLINTTLNRFERADVVKSNPGYSSTENNKRPGFNTRIDTSSYLDGEHILTINVLNSQTGEVLQQYSAYFNIKKHNSVLHWERPTQNQTISGKVTLSGWVMSDNRQAEIVYYLNKQKITVPTTRIAREDVIQGMPGYGGKSTNPTPGFSSILDLSNYLDGTYFLEMKIEDKITHEVLTADSRNIILKKYGGHLNIDHPRNSDMIGTSFVLDGWVLTDKKDAKLEVYLNDTKVDSFSSTTARDDVHQAMNNSYGGKTKNPLPGFSKTIDMTPYADGVYNLKLQAVNPDTGEVIVSDTRELSYQKYANHINLDHPTINSMVKANMTVDGWYLTSYQNNILEVYINDQKVNASIKRTAREDVHRAMNNGYGGKTTNPLPGFSTTIDMSSYQDGNYTVKLLIRSTDNPDEIIGQQSRVVTLKKYDTFLNVDHPDKKVKEDMTVDGWYLSTATKKHIEIEIDDTPVSAQVSYTAREDVHHSMNNSYGGKSTTPLPGFSAVVDLRGYHDGSHKLKVKVIDEILGNVIKSYEREFVLDKYDVKINLDKPASNANRNLSVGGWEVSTAKDELVRIKIDDEVKDVKVSYSVRPDVIASIGNTYGGEKSNPTPGFNALVDLSDYADGSHEITIEVIDKQTGDVLESVKRKFHLQKYAGMIHLETPQTSMLNEKGLFVAGWEVSELDNSYVKVYLDGKVLSPEIVRAERPDVNMPEYGGTAMNATPAFAMILDLSNLGVGGHKLKLELYSRLDEKLDSVEKELFIYRDIYFGIDVSDYQGNIDWQAVRNDGVQFAIIRAGYRGYGTGQIMRDEHFDRNISEALKYGVQCGVYFYSQAINEQEAVEEAEFVINRLNNYKGQIRFPIVFDTEFTGTNLGRADYLTTPQRTAVAKAFLDRIAKEGYRPMIYASRDFLYHNLFMNQLSSYDVWLAHYTNGAAQDPLAHPSNYTGPYQIWQYTSSGSALGINGRVDRNIAYKWYN